MTEPLDFSDDEIGESIQDVCSDSSTNYVVLGYVPKSDRKLKVVDSGDGGLEEMKENLSEGKVLFALVQMKVNDNKKLVYISWCGSSVMGMKKGLFSAHASEVGEKLFIGFHVHVTPRDEDEINEKNLTQRLSKATGANYGSGQHHAPSASKQKVESKEFTVGSSQNLAKMTSSSSKTASETLTASEPLKKEETKQLFKKKESEADKREKEIEIQEKMQRQQKAIEKKLEEKAIELSTQFPELQLEQIKDALSLFQKYDEDKNNVLDREEFAKLKKELHPNLPQDFLERIVYSTFQTADSDKSGGIDALEFLGSYEDIFIEERNQLAKILSQSFPNVDIRVIEKSIKDFEHYDLDHNGIIDLDEFYQLKEEIAPQMSKILLNKSAQKQFEAIDADKSGFIDGFEFMSAYQEIFSMKANEENKDEINELSLFREFEDARTFSDTLRAFESLKEICDIKEGDNVYLSLREKLKNDIHSNVLWMLLEKKRKQDEYSNQKYNDVKVLVIGAGPGGLRSAIEASLLGCQSTIRDIKNIGGKFFYPKFCVGGIHHIAIRQLQLLLLKICLILGVKVYHGVQFTGVTDPSGNKDDTNGYLWCANIEAKENLSFDSTKLYFNVLIGADGENSLVAKIFNFERKIFQGSQAIGLTANFVNRGTKEETSLREFGILSVYHQEYFGKLKKEHNIDLENLVYYRGETHYFVMTAKKTCLVEKGVIKNMTADNEQLLQSENVSKENLESFLKEVARFVGLPPDIEFETDGKNRKDAAIFDFSRKKQSQIPCKVMEHQVDGKKILLLTTLVGDSLVEPFWPQGTGANRAVLSALDTAWMIKEMKDHQIESLDHCSELLDQWAASYKVMVSASPEDLHPNLGAHTIDPVTRYKKTTIGHFM